MSRRKRPQVRLCLVCLSRLYVLASLALWTRIGSCVIHVGARVFKQLRGTRGAEMGAPPRPPDRLQAPVSSLSQSAPHARERPAPASARVGRGGQTERQEGTVPFTLTCACAADTAGIIPSLQACGRSRTREALAQDGDSVPRRHSTRVAVARASPITPPRPPWLSAWAALGREASTPRAPRAPFASRRRSSAARAQCPTARPPRDSAPAA
jgi:hypothetical protein